MKRYVIRNKTTGKYVGPTQDEGPLKSALIWYGKKEAEENIYQDEEVVEAAVTIKLKRKK